MLSKKCIDMYLDRLSSKVLERFGPEANIKIVIVGGAAIALNYKFRESTMDIDTYSRYSSVLDELAIDVAKEEGLAADWLNHNVMVTPSFTCRIEKFATPYKVFNGVLNVYTADALTLICMKSVCCRHDSHDIPDIEELLNAEPNISFTDIVDRFISLYGDWDKMKMDAQLYLTGRFNAMPPDMVEMIWEMLPPALKETDERPRYEICSEYYKQFLS